MSAPVRSCDAAPAATPPAKPVAGPRAPYRSPGVTVTVTPLNIPPIGGRWLLVARTDGLVGISDATVDHAHPNRVVATRRTVAEAKAFAEALVAKGVR